MQHDQWSIWGDPGMRDPSINQLGEWKIKKMIVRGDAQAQDVGNGHTLLRLSDGHWTILTVTGWKSDHWPTEDEAYGRPDTTYQKNYLPWNPAEWMEKFHRFSDKRQPRKEAFAATIQAVKAGEYTTQSGKLVKIPPDRQLSSGTRLYSQALHVDAPAQVYQTEICVEQEDCLAAAERLVRGGEQKAAVLNMADRQTPGGGVYFGAGAQEASCFRRSNYYLSLYPYADFAGQFGLTRRPFKRYPLDRNFGGCFSPNVTVFRGPEEEGYPFLEEPWKVSFIAVPALNRPELTEDPSGEERIAESLVPAAKNKIRTVFNIAIQNGIEVLVLGALGCGAYQNPPRHVAELFAQILEEPPYRGRFRKLIFAILSEGDDRAFHAFRDVFSILDIGTFKTKSEAVRLRVRPGTREIGADMFQGFTGLKAVSLPQGVEEIGHGAFQGLTQLETVELPDTLKTICSSAFEGCTSLRALAFPPSITHISSRAFCGCTSLESVQFHPATGALSSIGWSAFEDCTSLRTVSLPDCLRSIDSWAFQNCARLERLTLPRCVASIGASVFSGCASLAELTLPDGLESIGFGAFRGCGSLRQIILPAGLKHVGGDCQRIGSTDQSFAGNPRWTSAGPEARFDIVLPWKERIPACAFVNCTNLEYVVLPDTVTAIGKFAFYGCKRLKTVVIPDSVETIEAEAFAGCRALTELRLPAGLKKIGDRAFQNCSGLERLTLPGCVEEVGSGVFSASDVRTAVFPAGVRDVGSGVFKDCPHLTAVTFAGDCPVTASDNRDDMFSFSNMLNAGFEQIKTAKTCAEPVCTIRYPAGNKTWTDKNRQRGPVEWGIRKEIIWIPLEEQQG